MDTFAFLLVLSTLSQLVVPSAPLQTSVKAVAELVSGDSRIFSGESVRLKCSITDDTSSSWVYLWFRGNEQLSQQGEDLLLWRARIQESGEYYCQGMRDALVGNIYTLKSDPVEINVDGGWAILQVPPHPSLVGDTVAVTCRVRGTPELHGVILYKDGVEVMRQNGLNPQVYLTNLSLRDAGMYACRASWDADRRTRSVISVYSPVQVLEVLSEPVLEIVADDNQVQENKIKLICHVQYNARAPAPPVYYYFYKNNNQLGTATSENQNLVKQTPGQYSCEAKVQELGISRRSEPIDLGQVTGPQTTKPSAFHPRDPWTLAPPATAAPPAPRQPTASLSFIQPSHPAPSPPQSTIRTHYGPATPFGVYEEHGEISGSGDMFEELGDVYEESGDMFEESGDMFEESGDMFEESGDMFEESGDMFEESGDMFEESGDMFEESGDMFEESGDMFEESGDMFEESGDMFE